MIVARRKPAPARGAWLRRRLVDVVLAGAVVGVLLAVSSTAPRWARLLRQPLPAAADEGEAPAEGPVSNPAPEVERSIRVKLFFEAQDGGGLVIEEREVLYSSLLARQIEIVVGELVAGSRDGLAAPLPPETRVLGAFVGDRGVAYVNLSGEALQGQPGGSRSELLAVYSLVDSIVANFPAVQRVQILVDDRPAETLAGHVDLSRPLPPDMSLLAALPLSAVEPDSAAPAPPGGGGATP